MKYLLNFFSSLAANLFALAIFFLAIPAILLVILGIKAAMFDSDAPRVSPEGKYALVIDMSKGISEYPHAEGSFSNVVRADFSQSTYSVCSKIEAAASDPSVAVVFLTGSFENSPVSTSYAQIAEVREALAKCVQSKKEVVAYLERPSLRDYFLASAATTVALAPFSELGFKGIGGNTMFFGNAFKKYGVDVKVVKVGKLKSFGEMFTSDKMSPPVRENYEDLLLSVWDSVSSKISASRKLGRDRLSRISGTLAILSSREAKSVGLVDRLMYRDEIVAFMSEKVGVSGGTFKQLPIRSYSPRKTRSPKSVAVVYMNGEISDASPAIGIIDVRSYSDLLRELRLDEDVGAVVLRINSGGGGAYASEAIRREVELLAKCKPVVASVGGIAASGAYWISTAANKIVADSESITGSIGVFSALFSARELAAGFGVTFDSVKTSPMADIGSVARPPTESEIERIKKLTEGVYDRFVSLVSSSRNLPAAEVMKLADGGVYSGEKAFKLKLIDALCGLSGAVSMAGRLAGMDGTPPVEEYPKIDSLKLFMGAFSDESSPFAKSLKPLSDFRRSVENILKSPGIYARVPFDFEVK